MSIVKYASTFVLISSVGLLAGCPGDKDESSGVSLQNPDKVGLTTIATAADAAKAGGAVLSADETADDLSDLSGGLDMAVVDGFMPRTMNMKLPRVAHVDENVARALSTAAKAFAKPAASLKRNGVNARVAVGAVQTAATEEIPCDEGTMKYTSTENSSQTGGTLEIVFSNCKEIDDDGSYELSNGKIKMTITSTETSASGKITIGDGDADLESGDLVMSEFMSGGVLHASMTASAKVEFSAAVDAATDQATSMSIEVDGRVKSTDSMENVSDEIAFDSLSIAMNGSSLESSNGSFDITMGGALEHKYDEGATTASPDQSEYLGFVNFHYALTETDTGTSATISGKVAAQRTPAQCGDGAYELATTNPVTRDLSGALTGGDVTINTTTTIHANSDGSIVVTFNGASQTFTSEDEMHSSVCGV